MNNRERVKAILNYQDYDRMPVVSFGYWPETFEKWYNEGHFTKEQYEKCNGEWGSGEVLKQLGFDFDWGGAYWMETDLFPRFEPEELEVKEDGSRIIRDENGLIVLVKPGVVSIPAEIGTTMTGREAWDNLYKPRLQYSDARVREEEIKKTAKIEFEAPYGINVGSLMGRIRDLLGVEQLSYLYYDDEELYVEIVETFADLAYKTTKKTLELAKQYGLEFDYGHFWEDICFKNGPLVVPDIFDELVGPHYKRITDLLNQYGINIVSLDCDGCIDKLIPTWIKNGVNTMFPMEVGTWNASIAPWREKYGKELRGIGGMNKTVFAQDYKAVEAEIERLKPLIELGGYIPCPDHRIAPDAKYENVQYYCELMRKIK